MILLICIFIFFIFKYYSSNKNLSNKNYNRLNIDQIINEKINNLPILDNDTNNVVEFNDSFDDEINKYSYNWRTGGQFAINNNIKK